VPVLDRALDRPLGRAGATFTPVAAPATSGSGRLLATFAVLWAFAALFHVAAYPDRAVSVDGLLVALPALWLLARPASPGRLALLAALQLVQVGTHGLASTSNHWIVVTAVNVGVLGALLPALWRGWRGRPADPDAVLGEIAPVGRAALAVLYFYAVFQKLNADFLNPALSCATTQYADLAGIYPFLPRARWVEWSVIWGTLAIEALIPVLLLVRRTRVAAVLGAGAFHFLLALNPDHTFFDFTSMLFALYFLFVPFDYAGALREGRVGAERETRRFARFAAALASSPKMARLWKGAVLLVGAGLAGAYAAGFVPWQRAEVNFLTEATRVAFVGYAVVVLAVFAAVARANAVGAVPRARDAFRFPRPALAVPAVLLFVNGLTPHLGLKTEGAFAMFSNLRTEGGRTNHLLYPAGWRVAGYQDDLVRVVASSDRNMRRFVGSGLLLPFEEFRVRASRVPDASVTYERGGRLRVVPRVGDAAELAPESWFDRTFLRFRPVDDAGGGGQRCRH
jgi:hypothetical protein